MFIRPRVFLALSFLALIGAPQMASAKLDLYNPNKKYKDEKIAINDPTSRCMTVAFQNLYNNAVKQAEKDLAATKNKESASVQAAYATYEKDISLGWEAMQQPYCGFGAFGASAAQKSFKKTLTRARSTYLAQVKLGAAPAAPAAAKVATTTTKVPPVKAPVVKTKTLSITKTAIIHTLQRGQRSAEVKALQDILVKEGLLSVENATGYFGEYTEKAVIDFQVKYKLISSRSAPGAGLVGPKTREALNS